ncbi:DoxX family protein [Rhodoplanes roseus]|uniref:DoxX family protein n=1 Tax=Rhodoplanes roseus TaxID=29409 RepID=A0A327KP96_9BRAD|nr:DoxX family protein [Rhodoplanes roseus]RAI39185.1 hypothetical protein CH341_26375 [Rhodoplanes roseus]
MLAAGYAAAGVAHLMRPEPFVAITPDWVPRPRDVILITGALEIAGAAALLAPRTRKIAGAALALYAVCVFPANVKHAVEGIALPPVPDSWWYHAPRLAFQPVLVWAALFCSGLVDWPARRPSAAAPRASGQTSH